MNISGLRFSPRSLSVLFAAIGVFGGLGCPFENTQHCANPSSDAAVACAADEVCSKCESDNNGCVKLGGETVVSESCMLNGPSTGTTEDINTSTDDPTLATVIPTIETTDSTTMQTTMDVTITTSTGTDPVTTDPDTTVTATTEDTECDPDEGDAGCVVPRPYCTQEGDCVPCSELDCEAIDATRPVCVTEPNGGFTGLCVECLTNDDCSDAEPFCDTGTATCNKCTMHEQCPATACNLETGECFPEQHVLYVEHSPANNCSDMGPGTSEDKPFCKLQPALAAVGADPTTIRLKQGDNAQADTNVVPPNVTVAIVMHGAVTPALARSGGTSPALSVSEGSLVFVHRVAMNGVTPNTISSVLSCTKARVWLERLTVSYGKNGIVSSNCMVHVRRSAVFQNQNGGIDMSQSNDGTSKLWLENSYVTANGSVYGIRASNNSYLDILYSTIAGNVPADNIPGISCLIAPQKNLRLRNSMVTKTNGSPNPYVKGCAYEVETDEVTNYFVEATLLNDLVELGVAAAVQQGVVLAQPGGPLKGYATWLPGDPVHDYNQLNVRPDEDNGMDYAGADVP